MNIFSIILQHLINESIAAIESSGSQLLCSLNDGEYNLREGLIQNHWKLCIL